MYLEFRTQRVDNTGLEDIERVVFNMKKFLITQADNSGSYIEDFALLFEGFDLFFEGESESGN